MCPIFSGYEDNSCLKLARTDLTPVDFCLWGWMKSEVYKEKVNTRDGLVVIIMNSAALIKQDDLRRAYRSYSFRFLSVGMDEK